MTFIFVFGSNTAGRHGKGAALHARKCYGANYGQGVGLQGRSYAIPTKNEKFRPLPLIEIEKHVDGFVEFARKHPELSFYITPIGCGLAGYNPEQIAPMFKGLPANCHLPIKFKQVLGCV